MIITPVVFFVVSESSNVHLHSISLETFLIYYAFYLIFDLLACYQSILINIPIFKGIF